ncbi:MAG TPA: glycerol-3-phosphate acyltransferase [Spirochaetota bacterium]|nr:glycerol-3-phosphate acyltransferase [Spirochaetota bacterium]
MKLIILIAVAYLAGSVNFAILLFKILGKEDPRLHYSGNAGTTNVYRMAGPAWAAAVLLLDIGRAVVIALLARYALTPGAVPWAGLALVIGNRYPCFHQLRGGKGVANYLGFSAVITPAGAVVSCIAWVCVYVLKRVPFIASFAMIAVLTFGTIAACGYRPAAITAAVITALFIMFNHRANITSMMQDGKEKEKTNAD